MDNKGAQLLEQRLDYFEQSPEGCNWKVSFEENELNDLKSLLNKYKELDKDNNDLRRLYRRTAIKLQESGKHELAEYFLAQINEIPTFFVEDDIDYYSEYYRLLEENKRLRKHEVVMGGMPYISVMNIQNTITKLQENADNSYNKACIYDKSDVLLFAKDILQELIEEGNKSNE